MCEEKIEPNKEEEERLKVKMSLILEGKKPSPDKLHLILAKEQEKAEEGLLE